MDREEYEAMYNQPLTSFQYKMIALIARGCPDLS
jgi:hypothetical protein